MIKLSAKGIAKYIVSSPATQRRIVQDFKYPASEEPFAMRMYYREATDRLKAYMKGEHSNEWLREQAAALAGSGQGQSAAAVRRLQQNADAILLYERQFAGKNWEVLDVPRMRLTFHAVAISVVPDLHLRHLDRAKLIKLQFGGARLPQQSINVMTQCLLQAGLAQGLDLSPACAIYIDLPRDAVHSVRAGKKTLRDIIAACETISLIWDSIPPPRSRRSAAA
jgi:hypothetical protein